VETSAALQVMVDVMPTPTIEDAELGNVSMKSAKQGAAVTLHDVSYTVKVKAQPLVILDKVNGIFSSGRMTALMGPSGSGKTTLLDVVAGRKSSGAIEGRVLYGGVRPPRATLRQAVGYVEQFDTLVGELSVRDMLMYTAELRLPTTLSATERRARVDEVLSTLGLEACANTVIGGPLQRGISGGQLKRTNIGLALITKPSVIFLDEPTSGLDSHMANEVAVSLAALAADGRTVVCTIHSPTSYAFSKFDDLIMLKQGRVAYHGPCDSVAGYLQKTCGVSPPQGIFYSLPEWLVSVTSEATGDSPPVDWVALFEKSTLRKDADALRDAAALGEASGVALAKEAKMPGSMHQLGTLLRYRMTTHYKSGEFLGPRIGDKIIFGLLILGLYYGIGNEEDAQSIQSTASLLYFVSALCGYGAAAFVPSLTLDRPLFYRELADGCYSPLVYYLSKFIEEAFLCIFTSSLFSCIVFFGVQLQGSFWTFFAVYYLTTMNGITLAYAVAAVAPNMDAANALLPTLVTMWMYFGGLFLLFDKIPVYFKWLSWTSFLRYSWGAQMLNQYKDSSVGRVPAYVDQQANTTQTVLDFYGLEGDIMGSEGVCVALLAVCTLCFATCGAAAIGFIRFGKR